MTKQVYRVLSLKSSNWRLQAQKFYVLLKTSNVRNLPPAVFERKAGSWDFGTQQRRHFVTLKSNCQQVQRCQINLPNFLVLKLLTTDLNSRSEDF